MVDSTPSCELISNDARLSTLDPVSGGTHADERVAADPRMARRGVGLNLSSVGSVAREGVELNLRGAGNGASRGVGLDHSRAGSGAGGGVRLNPSTASTGMGTGGVIAMAPSHLVPCAGAVRAGGGLPRPSTSRPPHQAALATSEPASLRRSAAVHAALARESTSALGAAWFSHLRQVFAGSEWVLHLPVAALQAHGNLSVVSVSAAKW